MGGPGGEQQTCVKRGQADETPVREARAKQSKPHVPSIIEITLKICWHLLQLAGTVTLYLDPVPPSQKAF